MKRREFVGGLGSMMAWPVVAGAQHPDGIRRVGVLMGFPATDAQAQTYMAAFLEGLNKLGWTEGQNIKVETRWATHADADARRVFAQELIALRPDVILSNTTPTTAALLEQTRTIPIVFAMIADPVGSGFVASFPRPGGNATGFVVTEGSLGGKWLQLIKEIAPGIERVAMLYNPIAATYAQYWLDPFKAAAAEIGVEAIPAPIRDMQELETVLATLAGKPNSGFAVMPDSFTDAHREEITSLANRYRLPAIYAYRFFVVLGGLLSYGIDLTDNFYRSASYVDRILKGEKPADLPVQAPTKYVLTINLKTAKALGINVPLYIQQRADEVIE
jgi:putative ABC transport system substrate-binding protein